tara:strand:- start:3643 stop:4131 length:489 start_codon:yes stop_codon:yes gene_type:complete
MDKSLTGYNILSNVECNILKYSDIKNYNDIDDLLHNDKCIILYETKHNSGHWTCIYKHNKTIYFFDPYGNNFTEQTKFIPKYINTKLKQEHNKLIKLLYNSPYKVEYNEHQLQKYQKGVNTCGRWCIIRLQYPELSIKEFNKLFKNKKLSPDDIILKLTKNI